MLSNLETRGFEPDAFAAQYREIFKTSGQRALIREVLKVLCENSIIGYKRPQQNKIYYQCFNDMRSFEDAKTYVVHPGLVAHLGLIDSPNPTRGAVDP